MCLRSLPRHINRGGKIGGNEKIGEVNFGIFGAKYRSSLGKKKARTEDTEGGRETFAVPRSPFGVWRTAVGGDVLAYDPSGDRKRARNAGIRFGLRWPNNVLWTRSVSSVASVRALLPPATSAPQRCRNNDYSSPRFSIPEAMR